jgi:hypothetical protein
MRVQLLSLQRTNDKNFFNDDKKCFSLRRGEIKKIALLVFQQAACSSKRRCRRCGIGSPQRGSGAPDENARGVWLSRGSAGS